MSLWSPTRAETARDCSGWMASAGTGTWVRMARNDSGWFERAEVYAVCLESLDSDAAETLHRRLLRSAQPTSAPWRSMTRRPTIGGSSLTVLVPGYRVLNRAMHVFWEGPDENSKVQYRFDLAVRCGFEPVEWESETSDTRFSTRTTISVTRRELRYGRGVLATCWRSSRMKL